MGRGDRTHRSPTSLPPGLEDESESPEYLADLDAFADAIVRVTELGLGDREDFGLDPRIAFPALDLLRRPHGQISRAHAELLRACLARDHVLRGVSREAVPVRVIDLTASPAHLHALVASIACLVQATSKSNPRAAVTTSMRDGLVGEGLADAYFKSVGWEPVAGIGAFHRDGAGTYGARLVHGHGLDHLFRRRRGRTVEFLVAETKMHKSDGPLEVFLRRQFDESRLQDAGSESFATPALSPAWLADRLQRAHVRGALEFDDFQAVSAAIDAGRLRRAAVVVACPEYDRPGRLHAPDPDGLWVDCADGRRPLADEVVTLRVPKPVLTTLASDIGSARARSIATIIANPNSDAARFWGGRNG